jgi:signal peptidase
MGILKKLSIVAGLGLIVAWFLLLCPTFLGGPATYVIVAGMSMEPTYSEGDLVVLRTQDTYHSGDVIAFSASKSTVIHRIVGGSAEEGFITQGDNKDSPDSWRPTPEDIRGKAWLHISHFGDVMWFFQNNPLYLGLLAGALTVLALVGDDFKWGSKRRSKRR